MALREIIQLGNAGLYTIAEKVQDPMSSEVSAIITDLDESLVAFRAGNGFGRGIAAPQIGVSQRVIFIRMEDGSFEGPLINPRIVQQSEETIELWDSCFSFPHLVVRVSRAAAVTVEFLDLYGLSQTIEASDGLSELLQHEIDHLNGILATDRALSDRAIMTRVEWKRNGSPV